MDPSLEINTSKKKVAGKAYRRNTLVAPIPLKRGVQTQRIKKAARAFPWKQPQKMLNRQHHPSPTKKLKKQHNQKLPKVAPPTPHMQKSQGKIQSIAQVHLRMRPTSAHQKEPKGNPTKKQGRRRLKD